MIRRKTTFTKKNKPPVRQRVVYADARAYGLATEMFPTCSDILEGGGGCSWSVCASVYISSGRAGGGVNPQLAIVVMADSIHRD